MAIPPYLWIKDEAGIPIKGSVDVNGREGSIEVLSFIHGVDIPTDNHSGQLTGVRVHSPLEFEKEIDCSSPFLLKASTTGQRLQSVEIKWYRINYAGQEEEYYNILLEGVRVVSVNTIMHNFKSAENTNHLESVTLRYEKITWKYCDGNLSHSDSWKNR
ncbi:type VI secretion system tube protein Hcp [Chimaeribacter arupi]|uniref:Type VI secretion system tube protein Hcp n=1 Tax=Chimaeribacter arupi TaxID=2060066 RepID=A0A2N5ENG2_9GAMM|nr:Hcp family type VI secretion system effector [Chimaeribacter arupi]PLR47538.1 type VI secretion system tube protein Hcp [Chimaeribacter arupi]PLR50207.1 type VI secretion system tube protein Hcp [Chimaeribacter arupi]